MTRARIIHAAAALALLSGPLWADTGSQSSPASGTGGTGCIGIIILYLCYKRKGEEIGGALLYFYIQVYLGTLLTAVMLLRSIGSYAPSSWSAAPQLYPWFLASALPATLVIPAQLFVAERLRLSRNDRFLQWLRAALWAQLAVALTGGAIDAVHFREYLIFDVIGLVWPSIWLPYFYRSARVRKVFTTKDWHVPDSTAVLGLGAALRQASASDAPPSESGDQTLQGASDLSLRQVRRQEETRAAPRPSVQELLAVEAQLDRSFTVCVAALFAALGWVLYLHGAELEATTWGRVVLAALAAVLLAGYVWFAWSVGRAAKAVGSGRALYLTWVLVAPFLALLPIPFVSVALAASPLSLKFLLSSQLRSQIHDRTFEDV